MLALLLPIGLTIPVMMRHAAIAQTTEPPAEALKEPVSVVNLTTPIRPQTMIDEVAGKADPASDNWETEVLAESADKQLKVLAELIEHPSRIGLESVSELITNDFACQALRPATLTEVFNDGAFRVRRSETRPGSPQADSVADHHGGAGLVAALGSLVDGLGEGQNIRAAFKQHKIERSERFFTTRVFFEASNHSDEGSFQQNGQWLLRWTYPKTTSSDKPRLIGIGLKQYEEIELKSVGGKLFADYTASAMRHNASYEQQTLPGINHWATRISRIVTMSIFGHHGLAIGDVNGDGLEDLYVCDSGGLPNQLYLQNPDGTATDASSEAGVDWLENSSAALLIDLDNDGDQDLVIATFLFLLISENDGNGRFTLRQGYETDAEALSLCAADYDEDSDLDIYVCSYYTNQTLREHPIPYHDAHNGGPNMLFRNDGQFQFTDVTKETGLNVNNTRFSFAGAWEDYDNDGDLDLYVANDFGRNCLYRNDGGRFTDVAADAGVEDIASGMAVTWSDYNRDGHMDVYVSNMFSAAGNRITFQRQFLEQRADQTSRHLQRMARGNTLFANAGDGAFHDVTEAAAVSMGRWAWSSDFADLNNDGWQDLVVTNGYFTNQDTGDL